MRRFTQQKAPQRPHQTFPPPARAITALLILSVLVTAAPARAKSEALILFSISPQSLSSGVIEFSRQANVQVLTAGSRLDGVNTPGVKGRYSITGGMRHLLAGTGFRYNLVGTDTITLVPPADRTVSADSSRIRAGTEQPASGAEESASEQGRDTANATEGESVPALQEIIVSATKRIEDVRKISGSVSAFTGAQLEALGANSFEDYLTRVPGVVFNAGIPGFSTVAIRGVDTSTSISDGQEATGYFINDIPLTDPYSAVAIPDIDTFDVDNVTVLRGPQATLFGSASLGGSVNYQTASPDLRAYHAHFQITGDGVDHGGKGYSTKAMVNVPVVAGVLAVRGVFIYRQDPGYVDNVGTQTRNANDTLIRGGRVEAKWVPTSGTKVNYLFLDQTEDNPDWPISEPSVGELKKDSEIPEPFDFSTRINSLRFDQDLGFATLTATAAYHQKGQFSDTDETSYIDFLLPGATGPAGSPETVSSNGSYFEARLTSPTGGRLEYLIGVMHDDTRIKLLGTNPVNDAAQLIDMDYGSVYGANIGEQIAADGSIFDADLNFDGKESAIFGEASYHINSQWKVTLGGRQFWTQSSLTNGQSGFLQLLSSGTDSLVQSGRQHQNGFTPKASITWTPNDNVLTYALVSEGFRFGGPNTFIPEQNVVIPSSFRSDSLINYEIGTRTTWLDGRLQLDGTVFYIDWSNLQVQLPTPDGLGTYGSNAGDAHNYGVESTATWRATQALTIQTNVTYLNASLAEASPVGASGQILPEGTVLPGASRWSVASTASYQWESLRLMPTLLISQRYRSAALSSFLNGVPVAGFDQADTRLTLHLSDQLQVSGFVNNIFDSHGVTGGSDFGIIREFLVQPRTFGITMDYQM